MSQELYYTPPTQECFEDMKQTAIRLWLTYDDTHGYATEKVDTIKNIQNVGDNFMYIYAMFDYMNKAKINKDIKLDTLLEVYKRL